MQRLIVRLVLREIKSRGQALFIPDHENDIVFENV